jgi:hypothetical protein
MQQSRRKATLGGPALAQLAVTHSHLVCLSCNPLKISSDLHAGAHPQTLNASKLRAYLLQISPQYNPVQEGLCFQNSCLLRMKRPAPLVVPSKTEMAFFKECTLNRTFCKSTQAGGVTIERTCNKESKFC